MHPGWYILNYHNVDWEDSILTRAIGGTTRPDVFRHHLETIGKEARFVSVPEGQEMLDSGQPFDEPVVSLWFDDGFAGVYECALPICRELRIRPAFSVCSRFVDRTEMFWRAKLSYLAHADCLRFVRARLRKAFDGVPFRIRGWTLQCFSPQVLAIIDDVYARHASETFQEDAYRIFANREQIDALAEAGWLITNHSAAHWPLSLALGWEAVEAGFDECESFVRRWTPANPYWVVPFSYGGDSYRAQLAARATTVEVGEQRNTHRTWRETGRIFRFEAPMKRDVLAALR